MKKVLKRLSVLITVGVIFTYAINSVAFGEVYKINSFTGYPQEMSNWCWVACAETSGKHFGNNIRTQRNAVTFVKGSPVNEGGNIAEIATAANYFSLNKHNYIGYNHAYSVAVFKVQITNDRMPILGLAYYNSSGNRTGGHAVVAYMVTYNDNGTRGIGYYDPWDNRNYICSFEDLKNGTGNNGTYEETCYTNT